MHKWYITKCYTIYNRHNKHTRKPQTPLKNHTNRNSTLWQDISKTRAIISHVINITHIAIKIQKSHTNIVKQHHNESMPLLNYTQWCAPQHKAKHDMHWHRNHVNNIPAVTRKTNITANNISKDVIERRTWLTWYVDASWQASSLLQLVWFSDIY